MEASGLVVSLAFGAFSILTMFGNTVIVSPAWIALCVAYVIVIYGIWAMFPHWAQNIREIEYVRKRISIEERIFPPWFTQEDKEKSIARDSKEQGFFDRHFAVISQIVIIVMGIVLWVTLAFHCGFGDTELLNPACY